MKAAAALAICLVVACDDGKPAPGDTSALPENTIQAAPDDTIGIDSASTHPGSQPPPPVTGESPREGPPVSRDPMPPLTGETSKQGGTMPVYRDSASGPKMEIDSKGRIVPIKKD
jgi:hypothetical protein